MSASLILSDIGEFTSSVDTVPDLKLLDKGEFIGCFKRRAATVFSLADAMTLSLEASRTAPRISPSLIFFQIHSELIGQFQKAL
jgi:hypothetical protein